MGAIPTPKGLLRKGALVEGNGERRLFLWADTPEEAEAARTLLPQALALTPLAGAAIHVYGAKPAPPARLSALLDTRGLGLEVTLPAKGRFAVYWPRPGEILALSPLAKHLEGFFSLVGGREEEALAVLLKRLDFPDYDTGSPPPAFVLHLQTSTGRRALLSYRRDRGPRVHFGEGTPGEEIAVTYANLARILRQELLPVPRRESRPAWVWWQAVLGRSEEETLEAVGLVEAGPP